MIEGRATSELERLICPWCGHDRWKLVNNEVVVCSKCHTVYGIPYPILQAGLVIYHEPVVKEGEQP